MKLIVQPDAGIVPLVTAIKRAKKTVEVLIFRCDSLEMIHALEAAVARGVEVRALTAHTNRGGDKTLRKLELRLLAGGVSVSRSADDFIRYHGKMMIVDSRVLHLYGFNFTGLDISKSRSFGVITRDKKLAQEALKLFEADWARQPYTASHSRFVVSPENSREELSSFIEGARKELLIYDPKVTDDGMLRLITQRIKEGVEVRIIGKVEAKWNLPAEKYPGKRLHIRCMIRDGRQAFVGSQSLRKLELDKRREVGVIVHDHTVVRQMRAVFEEDWALTHTGRKTARRQTKEAKDEKQGVAAA